MKRFLVGADRGQSTLLPECLDEWIDEGKAVASLKNKRPNNYASRAGRRQISRVFKHFAKGGGKARMRKMSKAGRIIIAPRRAASNDAPGLVTTRLRGRVVTEIDSIKN